MRKTYLLLVLSLILNVGRAQVQELSFSYFAPYGIEPGFKLEVSKDLKSWDGNTNKKDQLIKKTLFISPQAALYNRYNYHTNYLLNIQVGVRRNRMEAKYFYSSSLGFGYLLNREVMSITTDFSEKIINREKESRSYITPNLTYEIGRKVNDKISCHLRSNLSYLISFSRENTFRVFTEIGITLYLTKTLTKS